MKPPCKSVVKRTSPTSMEMSCETCNRLLVVSEYCSTKITPAVWLLAQDRYWRDHLNIRLMDEKAGKSSPESVGGVVGGAA